MVLICACVGSKGRALINFSPRFSTFTENFLKSLVIDEDDEKQKKFSKQFKDILRDIYSEIYDKISGNISLTVSNQFKTIFFLKNIIEKKVIL
jgi:hypothetical protein